MATASSLADGNKVERGSLVADDCADDAVGAVDDMVSLCLSLRAVLVAASVRCQECIKPLKCPSSRPIEFRDFDGVYSHAAG